MSSRLLDTGLVYALLFGGEAASSYEVMFEVRSLELWFWRNRWKRKVERDALESLHSSPFLILEPDGFIKA